jgi:hypothetical protein
MDTKRRITIVTLAGGFAALSLMSAPAAGVSLDSDRDIIRIAAETPEIADEIKYLHALPLTDEPTRVILLWASCGADGCTREYLVIHQFSRDGLGSPTASLMTQVVMNPNGKVSWAKRVDLRQLEVDRAGHRRQTDPKVETVNNHVSEALRRGAPDVEAIRNPDLQAALAPCAAQARMAFVASALSGREQPRYTFMLVVRRTVDAEGKNPEVGVYNLEGYSEANATGFIWKGSMRESREGPKSQFPVSEIMDWMRVSPDGIVAGPFTPQCLANVERPKG